MQYVSLILAVAFLTWEVGKEVAAQWQRRHPPPSQPVKLHRQGCSWCGHFYRCQRLDCPLTNHWDKPEEQ